MRGKTSLELKKKLDICMYVFSSDVVRIREIARLPPFHEMRAQTFKTAQLYLSIFVVVFRLPVSVAQNVRHFE